MTPHHLFFTIVFVTLSCVFVPASACGHGGIGAPTSGALIALCVVFLPVIIPAVVVGGPTYLAYRGINKASTSLQNRKDRNQYRKRNSDIIKTQMSRAVKLVGKDVFANHIQTLYDAVKQNSNPQSYFDLGVGLFLSRDLLGAEEYLTKAIDMNSAEVKDAPFQNLGNAYFVRGLVNQYLWDFRQAQSDFQQAVQQFEANPPPLVPGNNIPQLTELDARNSLGFACALTALYGDHDEAGIWSEAECVELLDKAIEQYSIALDRVAVKQGMWFHNRGVARYFRTLHVGSISTEETEKQLNMALLDFQSAVGSGNFGTAADGYAMIAQTLARLHKPEAEINEYIDQAFRADPKVFMVDVTSEVELNTPWVLPRQEYPFKKAPHELVQKHFTKPTWCNHCLEFIHNPVGKQGYECVNCKYRVHSKCFPQVKGKNCWDKSRSPASSSIVEDVDVAARAEQHTHHFKEARFNKPTWCSHCSKFVVGVIGKQGYSCVDCTLKVHKECVNLVERKYID